MSGRKSCRVYVGNLAWRVKWPDLKDHMKAVGTVNRADVFEDRTGRSQGCGIVEFATPEEAALAIEKMNNTELFGRQMFVREDREDDTEERRAFSGGAGGAGPGAGAGGHGAGVGHRGGHRGGGRGGFGGGGGRGGGPYAGAGFGGFEGGGGGYGGYGPAPGAFGGYSGYGGGGVAGFRGGGMLTPANALRDHVKGRQVFVGNLNFQTTWQDLKDLFREVADVQRADVFQDPFGASKGCGTVVFETPEDAEKAVEKFHNYSINGRTLVVRIDQGPTRGGRRQG